MTPTFVVDGLAVFDHQGDGDVVVLLHPGNMDHRCWDSVIAEALPDAGSPRLVAYDRRGYGASTSDGGVDHLEDLRTVIDSLEVERVFLVGNSVGAGLACQYVLQWPRHVSGLLLVAPAVPGAPTPELAALPARERRLIERAFDTPDPEAGASAELRLWLDGAAANDGRVAGSARGRTHHLILDNRHRGGTEDAEDPLSDTWERLRDITTPAWIVAGGLDLGFVVDNATTMAARIPGARLETWTNAAHLLPLEHPRRVASAIQHLAPWADSNGQLEITEDHR